MSLLRLLSAVPRVWRWWRSCIRFGVVLREHCSDYYNVGRLESAARIGARYDSPIWVVYEVLARLNDDEQTAQMWLDSAKAEGTNPWDIVPDCRVEP